MQPIPVSAEMSSINPAGGSPSKFRVRRGWWRRMGRLVTLGCGQPRPLPACLPTPPASTPLPRLWARQLWLGTEHVNVSTCGAMSKDLATFISASEAWPVNREGREGPSKLFSTGPCRRKVNEPTGEEVSVPATVVVEAVDEENSRLPRAGQPGTASCSPRIGVADDPRRHAGWSRMPERAPGRLCYSTERHPTGAQVTPWSTAAPTRPRSRHLGGEPATPAPAVPRQGLPPGSLFPGRLKNVCWPAPGSRPEHARGLDLSTPGVEG